MTNAHAARHPKPLTRPLKVAELFAGVGGFRLGLEYVDADSKRAFEIAWGNQWEPSTRVQHAFEIYKERFQSGIHSNQDISKVSFESTPLAEGSDKRAPDVDVLVGGFPCQDYSVARTANQAAGILGKKGVLWWQIHRFLVEKGEQKPGILIFENVDRLLKSPTSQRGRDFAVLLTSLDHLGYDTEWRVINAADYGFPQRRRRVFIVGYHRSLELEVAQNPKEWLLTSGILAEAFPHSNQELFVPTIQMEHEDLPLISQSFNKKTPDITPFQNAGLFSRGKYWTLKSKPEYAGNRTLLKDVLIPENEVPPEFFIPDEQLPAWKYLKGAKAESRTNKKSGFKYDYTEGPIAFPDPLDRPSRTIITGEGGSGPSRFKHVVKVGSKHRRLTPVELEQLNCFPKEHTAGISDGKRAFIMGNALVVGVVQRIGQAISDRLLPGPKAPIKTTNKTARKIPVPA